MSAAIYSTEPGVRVDRRDLGVSTQTQPPTTETLLILGVAIDGPNDRVVQLSSFDDIQREFGPTDMRPELGFAGSKGFNGNELVRAAKEAWDGGCRSIALQRIGGTYASTYVTGYNLAIDTPVTLSASAAVSLSYGGFPTPNSTLRTAACTASTYSTNVVTYTSSATLTSVAGGGVGWTLYFPVAQWESKIVALGATTLQLADDVPTYVTASSRFIMYPAGNYEIHDTNGNQVNPANYVISAGSSSVNSTIQIISDPVTDSRYALSTLATAALVNFYMTPTKVINVRSLTPSNIYNSSGSFNTSTQDGCWLTLETVTSTSGSLSVMVPKYRNSPLTTSGVPSASIKFDIAKCNTYDDLLRKLNGNGKGSASIFAEIADDATWNGTAVVINANTLGGPNGLCDTPGGSVSVVDAIPNNAVNARFTGGTSGTALSKTAIYNILNGTGEDDGLLDSLLDVTATYRTIAGVTADDTVNGIPAAFTKLLTNHCWTASRLGYSCSGVIGATPQATTKRTAADIAQRVADLTATTYDANSPLTAIGETLAAGLIELDTNTGKKVDTGQYINVLVGPDCIVRDPSTGARLSNMAVAYAGQLAAMPINRSTTAYPMRGGALGVAYTYTRSQLDALTKGVGTDEGDLGGAYTTLRVDRTGALMVHSGETGAKRDSQFTKEGLVKVTQVAEFLLSMAIRQYLGAPNNLQTRNALQHACETALENLNQVGALSGGKGDGYEVTVSATNGDREIGRVVVDAVIKTAAEIRIITLQVTVQE